MRLVHVADGTETTLATRVDTADSLRAQVRGLTFRRSIPEDYALVFRFDRAARRDVHMLFVRFPLDVLWIRDERVERFERLDPWTGFGWGAADTIVELPGGRAEAVEPGDSIRLES